MTVRDVYPICFDISICLLSFAGFDTFIYSSRMFMSVLAIPVNSIDMYLYVGIFAGSMSVQLALPFRGS